ncbi:hypothetical protein ZWY2020_026438 [Hordeum vulgare]|nr:hypothetical protein ZWY2020_026438 [Hordeum vulgare]
MFSRQDRQGAVHAAFGRRRCAAAAPLNLGVVWAVALVGVHGLKAPARAHVPQRVLPAPAPWVASGAPPSSACGPGGAGGGTGRARSFTCVADGHALTAIAQLCVPWARVHGAARRPLPLRLRGRAAAELLVTKEAVALVAKFAAKGEVVGSIDQGHLVLTAAGLLKGKRCAGRVPMRVISNLTGAVGVEPEGAVADGKLVTAASWPDLAEFIAHLVDLLGITVSF